MAEPSLGQLVSELIGDLGQLIRHELRLARAEASEKVLQAERALYAVVIGLVLALCGLLILFQAVVVALSNVMPPWLAATVVGLGLTVFALVLIYFGRRSLKARNLLPRRTLNAVRNEEVLDEEHS